MSARLHPAMPEWPPYGVAVTALSDLAITALGVLHQSPERPRRSPSWSPTHWEQLAASILQYQGSDTYSVCRSRLPDSGMILIGPA